MNMAHMSVAKIIATHEIIAQINMPHIKATKLVVAYLILAHIILTHISATHTSAVISIHLAHVSWLK